MTDTQPEAEREIQSELEEFIARFERLSISPAPRPPLMVSKKPADIGLNLRSRRRKVTMAFKFGRG